MNLKAVIRDVLIIFALTYLSGFVIGLSGAAKGANYLAAIAIGNIIFSIVGFTISGALARTNRFKHLVQVALGVWLLGLINIFLVGTTIKAWALSVIFIVIAMGIGGLLSYLFARSPKPANS
jgi:hypothetical protein